MTYGIKEQIQNADSLSVIEKALKVGATFEHASPDTRRKWERAAKQRRDELLKVKGSAEFIRGVTHDPIFNPNS